MYYIKTSKLPEGYPNIELITCDESNMYDGMMAMSLGRAEGVRTVEHLYSIIDNKAQVRWLYTGVSCHVFMKLKNGNLIVDAPISSGICGAYTAAGFIEIDMLGRIINFFPIKYGLHHDVIELPNGNFLAITQRENTKQDSWCRSPAGSSPDSAPDPYAPARAYSASSRFRCGSG